MTSFFKGINFNIQGIQYFLKNKKLWKFVLIPLCISIMTLFLSFTAFFHYFDIIFTFFTKPLGNLDILSPQGFLEHFLDSGLWLLRHIIKVFMWIMSVAIILVFIYILNIILSSPFYELLTEKVLEDHQIIKETKFSWSKFKKDFLFSLKIELYKMIFYLIASIGFFTLNFIPFVNTISSLCYLVFTSWFFAFSLSSYPLVLRYTPFNKILKWGKSNLSLLIGFGLPSLIPFLGLFLMHFQVTGGALLYIQSMKDHDVS